MACLIHDRHGPAALLVLLAAGAALAAEPAGRLQGHARFEKIKGKPAAGYLELYETNLFLSGWNSLPAGPARRLGTTLYENGSCVIRTVHDGSYCIDGLSAGSYSILVNQPLFFVAPRIVPNVPVQDPGDLSFNVELGLDFSTYFKTDWVGNAPDTHPPDSPWYQTFVATGTAIRGVAFSFAGPNKNPVAVAILEDNGDADVRKWRKIAERTDSVSISDVTDNWVRFRSAEAPTVPGRQYAVRLTVQGNTIQPYKRNKDSLSYAHGRAYDSSSKAMNYDLCITVFSDNDNTMVTMNKRTKGLGDLRDGNFAWKWGQTFTARGASLAAVDVWAAGANSKWDLEFIWRVYPGSNQIGPTGPQIGPTKITQAAYQSFGVGLHGVSYNPNEILLTPGQSYFIEFEVHDPPSDSQGFNPFIMNDDSYDQGNGFIWTLSGWGGRPQDDVCMTVVEYALLDPVIQCSPAVIERSAFLGANAAPDLFSVANGGNGTMSFEVDETLNWLDLTPRTGTVIGNPQTVTISYATSALPLGTYQGTLRVSASGATNTPQVVTVNLHVVTVPADFNRDTDVDMDDFAHFQACYSGVGVTQADPACADARLDDDLDVDKKDFERFILCVSGAGIVADPTCVN
ncbi:MAG: hypothetical protein KA354_18595 [Phycisphaerae bacterium]|nr:hypothetical protein [Phycisphaerae bacterium]